MIERVGNIYDLNIVTHDLKQNIEDNKDLLMPYEPVISTDTRELLWKDEQGNIVKYIADFTVNTIADLEASSKFIVGDVVEVLGYYTAGDGAHHLRKISNINDGSGVKLANGLWANMVNYTYIKELLGKMLDTTKITGTQLSYFSFMNYAFKDDNGTRIYIEPAPKHVKDTPKINDTNNIIDGLGGGLKIFGDVYSAGADYRDLGVYFYQNQNNDTGVWGNGVFWINSKVSGTRYQPGGINKNPDIGFSFQDGKAVAGRFIGRDFGNGIFKSSLYLGGGCPKYDYHACFLGQLGRDNDIVFETKNGGYSVFGGTILKSKDDANVWLERRTDDGAGNIITSKSTNESVKVKNNSVISYKDYGLSIDGGIYLNKSNMNSSSDLNVRGKSLINLTSSVSTSIINIIGAEEGQEITIIFKDNKTNISNTGNIVISSNIVNVPTNSVLTLIFSDGKAYVKNYKSY